jgi:hypothetical protein
MNKKKLYFAFVLVVLLAMTGVLAACGNGQSGSGGGGVIPIKQIKKEVETNEAAAEEKYQDQVISISGVVTDIMSYGQEYLVSIGEDKNSIWSADCDGISNEDVLTLSTGDKIVVTGEVSNVSQYSGLILYNCYLGTTPPTENQSGEETPISSADSETNVEPEVKDAEHLISYAQDLGFSLSSSSGGDIDKQTGGRISRLTFRSNQGGALVIVPGDMYSDLDQNETFHYYIPDPAVDYGWGFLYVYPGAAPDGKYDSFVFFDDEDEDYPQEWNISEVHFDFLKDTLEKISSGEELSNVFTPKISDAITIAAENNGYSIKQGYILADQSSANQTLVYDFLKIDDNTETSIKADTTKVYSDDFQVRIEVSKHGNIVESYSKIIADGGENSHFDNSTNSYIIERKDSIDLLVQALNGDFSAFGKVD